MARAVLMDVYNIIGVGAVITVEIIEGTIRKGSVLNLEGREMSVKSIEAYKRSLEEATSGQVGMALSDYDLTLLRKYKGMEVNFDSENKPAPMRPQPKIAKGPFSFLTDLFRK